MAYYILLIQVWLNLQENWLLWDVIRRARLTHKSYGKIRCPDAYGYYSIMQKYVINRTESAFRCTSIIYID